MSVFFIHRVSHHNTEMQVSLIPSDDNSPNTTHDHEVPPDHFHNEILYTPAPSLTQNESADFHRDTFYPLTE